MKENMQVTDEQLSRNLKKYLISVPSTIVVLLILVVGSLAFAAGRLSVRNTVTPTPSIVPLITTTPSVVVTPDSTPPVKPTNIQKGQFCKNDDDCKSLPAPCAPNEPCPGYSCINSECVLDYSKAQTPSQKCTTSSDCPAGAPCQDGYCIGVDYMQN